MVHLAAELVHSILGNVDDHHDLVSCRLVSKSFKCAVAPVVWSTLRIRHSRKPVSESRMPFQKLATTVHISRYVKEMVYDATELSYPNPFFKDISGSLEDFSFFRNFCNLDTLRILFPVNHIEQLWPLEEEEEDFDFDNYEYANDEVVTPERKLRSAVFKKLAQIHLGHGFTVKHLELQNILPVPHAGMHADGLLSFLKSVVTLNISIAEVDSDVEIAADPTADDFYEIFKSEVTTLLKAPTTLESITYKGDRYAHGLDDLQWDGLWYPHLKCLCLEDVVFDNNSTESQHKVTRFILRHSSTLQELRMRSCMIDAENAPDIVTWTELFGVFKNNLESLRKFTFEPLPGRHEDDENEFRGYAFWGTEGGFSEYSEAEYGDPADAAADRQALVLFQAQLLQRMP